MWGEWGVCSAWPSKANYADCVWLGWRVLCAWRRRNERLGLSIKTRSAIRSINRSVIRSITRSDIRSMDRSAIRSTIQFINRTWLGQTPHFTWVEVNRVRFMWSMMFDTGLLKNTAKKCIQMFTNRNHITVNMLITLKCKETRLLSSHYRLNPFLSSFVSFISGDGAIEKSTQMKTRIFFFKNGWSLWLLI